MVWLQREHGASLPRVRTEGVGGFGVERAPLSAPPESTDAVTSPNAGLFTGSVEARERSRAFAGPSPEELAERSRNTAESRDERPA